MTEPKAADDPAEPLASATPAEENADATAVMTQRIATLEADVAAARDQMLRALAEAENTRRRLAREMEDQRQFAIANFARDLLSVPDNLRRALAAAPAELRADERFRAFAEGIELTERELLAILDRQGVKAVPAEGQPFDHNVHQAVMQVETAEQAPGTVLQAFQTGYTLNGRLLRPAMVTVAKAPPAPASEPGADDTNPT